MMPRPYPDELVYSVFARLHVRRGYLSYKDIAEELYDDARYPPSCLFFNKLKTETQKRMERIKPMNRWILENTMFPYITHFLPPERKKTLFEKGAYPALFCKMITEQCLYYCPECVREDRKIWGEAYWHCSHQIPGIRICAKHRCHLENSNVDLIMKTAYQFTPLETEVGFQEKIKEATPETDGNIIRLADFMIRFVNKDVKMISETLRTAAEKKGYGQYLNIWSNKVYEDICKKYGFSPFPPHYVTRALSGHQSDWYGMCILWEFLDAENVRPRKQSKDIVLPEDFWLEIAEKLQMEVTHVRTVGEEVLRKYEKENCKTIVSYNKKKTFYDRLDRKYLPAVRKAAKELYEKPGRVSVRAVAGKIDFPQYEFVKLPLCMKEIEKYQETPEEHWCRRLEHAYDELVREGIPICYLRIDERAHICSNNLPRCVPYMSKELKKKLYPYIRNLKVLKHIHLEEDL